MRRPETSHPRAQGHLPLEGTPEAAGLLASFTLVLWTGCLAVGWIGLRVSYPLPQGPRSRPVPPVRAEIVDVEVARLAPSPADRLPEMPRPELPAADPAPLEFPEAAPLIAVAAPTAAVAFALPVEGPVRKVVPAEADYAKPAVSANRPAPVAPAKSLTFGEGEGRQPEPEYPAVAVRSGHEGTVRVGLTVGENGRVLAAEIVSASPWPLLNDAALQVVRRRWRFAPGTVRRYEVSIRFELRK